MLNVNQSSHESRGGFMITCFRLQLMAQSELLTLSEIDFAIPQRRRWRTFLLSFGHCACEWRIGLLACTIWWTWKPSEGDCWMICSDGSSCFSSPQLIGICWRIRFEPSTVIRCWICWLFGWSCSRRGMFGAALEDFPLASSAANSVGWAFFLWLRQLDPLANVWRGEGKRLNWKFRQFKVKVRRWIAGTEISLWMSSNFTLSRFSPYHRMDTSKDEVRNGESNGSSTPSTAWSSSHNIDICTSSDRCEQPAGRNLKLLKEKLDGLLTMCIFKVLFVFSEMPQMLQMYWVLLWMSSCVFSRGRFLNFLGLQINRKIEKFFFLSHKFLTKSCTDMDMCRNGWFGALWARLSCWSSSRSPSTGTAAPSDGSTGCGLARWRTWWTSYHNTDKDASSSSRPVSALAREPSASSHSRIASGTARTWKEICRIPGELSSRGCAAIADANTFSCRACSWWSEKLVRSVRRASSMNDRRVLEEFHHAKHFFFLHRRKL